MLHGKNGLTIVKTTSFGEIYLTKLHGTQQK